VNGPATGSPARRLFDAVLGGDRSAVTDIVDEHPEAAGETVDGITALHLACAVATDNAAIPASDGGPVAHAIVGDLLAAGADVSMPGPDGHTPLHTAGFCGNVDLIDQLLAAGADPAVLADGVPGATALSFTLFYAHPEAGRVLADAGRSPDDLRVAGGLDDVARIDQLVDADGSLVDGADAGMAFTAPIDAFPPRTGPITDQLTLDESLTWASRNGALAAMDRLVDAGADVNANPYRGTALLWAVYSNRIDAARWLLDHDADPNLRHDFGGAEHGHQATALHLAAQFGSLGCIEVLLTAGADPTIRDGAFSGTPADWASHSGQQAALDRFDQA
jgi:ankyrin repeat protein